MPANYVLLEKITVGAAGAASVTFNSIPQTGYTDLVVKMSARTTRGYLEDSALMRFNGDSGSNYARKTIYGDGTSAASGGGAYTNIDFFITGNTATANTFGNTEIYIPNYTSANYKSVSVDAVTGNNASTTSINFLEAGVWNSTAAITSISITPNSNPLMQYSTFYLYGVAALNTTPAIYPKATGGDIIQTDGTYWYHAFLASGTFTPTAALSCGYLVVAGGGGGGDGVYLVSQGGGGGAGGLRSTVTATGGGGTLETAVNMAYNTAYTITIGAGGASNTAGSNSLVSGTGITTITSTGGGRGKGTNNSADGGSGGGGDNESTAAGAGTANQGFNGGAYHAGSNTAGGGGGAGAVGTVNTGTGGAGVAISAFATPTGTGVSSYYAGGGGGAGGVPGAAGAGGGGTGGAISTAGSAATANTGSGGGGGGSNTNNAGGAGGSGIVIIRYTIA